MPHKGMQWGFKETTTATATPQIKNSIRRMVKKTHNVCACSLLLSLPNEDVKFSHLSFWRQRKLTAVDSLPLHENHSCQANKTTLRLFETIWPTWKNCKTRKMWSQWSILKWHFRRSSRRSLFKSLILELQLTLSEVCHASLFIFFHSEHKFADCLPWF